MSAGLIAKDGGAGNAFAETLGIGETCIIAGFAVLVYQIREARTRSMWKVMGSFMVNPEN